MKAIDVATKNHITVDDVVEICREISIPCEGGDSELVSNDIFLVERRIEVVKKKKLEEAEKAKKNKKLKLKKRVHVSNDIKKMKGIEITESKGPEPKEDQSGVNAGMDDAVDDSAADDNIKIAEKAPDKKEATDKPVQREGERPSARPGSERRPSEGGATGQRPQQGGTGQRPYQGGQGQRPQQGGTGQRPQQGGTGQRPQQGGTGQRPQQGGTGQRPYQGGTGQRPQQGGTGQRPQQGGQGQRPQQGGPGQRPRPQGQGQGGFRPSVGKEEAPVSIEVEDPSKRKKVKDKEHEKGKEWLKTKKDKEVIEKDIGIKKKQALELKKSVTPDKISITESVSVGELAKKLNVKANEVISKLMKLGVMATINQTIDADTASILAAEYNTEVNVVSLFDETVIKNEQVDNLSDYITRPPVVTVMGHVDHGKTKLLDTIRKANVADGEHGGITQHIGAYTVTVNDKKITFLDTPGHAAFTTMRARGASITDIVILVVAANDGVMPQTIEAISHAKAAGVPIIVAINKIDLEDANPAKVRQELTAYDLLPEEWGGSNLFAEISAKQNINIEGLLELVLIQSEMLELKANPGLLAKGAVIESRLDPGRGAVSTVLVQSGTLHVGDSFVVGVYSGKVRAMFDDKGKPIDEAGASTPVEILGISGVPGAGDPFEGVDSDRFAKQVSQKRLEYKRIESAKKVRKVTLESLNEMIKDGEVQELNVIVKADVDGSTQALTESLEKLSNPEIRVRVIHSGTGGINDSDVMLAAASNAIIVGYHVRPTGKVADLADKENVSIKFYNIIFEVTDDIRAAMEGMLSPEYQQKVNGTGDIKEVFKISKIGTIAGSICMSGKISRKSKMRLIRNGIVIFDGELSSLKRYKDDVSIVEAGQEFGFTLNGFNDIKEGDSFEAYEIIEIAKKL